MVLGAQNLPCMPFHTAHLSFCAITMARLFFLGDDDPDWTPAVARDAVDFEGVLTRIADLFDAADKSCACPRRRAPRYFDGGQERTVLSTYQDKVRWIRDWYVARTRQARGYGDQQAAYYRGSEADSGGDAVPAPGGEAKEHADSHGMGSGGAMEVDYDGSQVQSHGDSLPGEILDEGFWQAMFDWSWNGPVNFQVEVPGSVV